MYSQFRPNTQSSCKYNVQGERTANSYTLIKNYITSLSLWKWNHLVTCESLLTTVHISMNNLCKKEEAACSDCCRVRNSRIRNTYGQSTETVVRQN